MFFAFSFPEAHLVIFGALIIYKAFCICLATFKLILIISVDKNRKKLN